MVLGIRDEGVEGLIDYMQATYLQKGDHGLLFLVGDSPVGAQNLLLALN